MKRNWDELVAAKQAERERQRQLEDEDLETTTTSEAETSEELVDRDTKQSEHHLVPNVIVTDQGETATEAVEAENVKFVKNSKQTYAELSRTLAKRRHDQGQHQKRPATEQTTDPELPKQHRPPSSSQFVKAPTPSTKKRDKSPLRVKTKDMAMKVKEKAKGFMHHHHQEQQRQPPPPLDAVPVHFTKTYSFRNLPKGRVAKIQQQFEATNSEDKTVGMRSNTTPLPHMAKTKAIGKKAGKKILPKISEATTNNSNSFSEAAVVATNNNTGSEVAASPRPPKIEVPVTPWIDRTQDLEQNAYFDNKPGSRQGFHASAPTLIPEANAIKNNNGEATAGDLKPAPTSGTYDPASAKEYLEALRQRRDKARQRASELHFYRNYCIQHPSSTSGLSLQHHKPRTQLQLRQHRDNFTIISWTEVSVQSVVISSPVFV